MKELGPGMVSQIRFLVWVVRVREVRSGLLSFPKSRKSEGEEEADVMGDGVEDRLHLR